MNTKNMTILDKLRKGNTVYRLAKFPTADISLELRHKTANAGQHPDAIVITCSDSRVIPEAIFNADLGTLFVIRVAGNVLDNHQLGSIEYAASHLNVGLIIMLGHTRCGAISATINGNTEGFIKYITDDISIAIGSETDDLKATMLNVKHGVNIIKQSFAEHPEIPTEGLSIIGAVYDIESGDVKWL